MGICGICGQPLTGAPHVCPTTSKIPSAPDRQMRGNIVVLALLALSFGLFIIMFSFVLLHPVAAGQPILIQTATPANVNNQGQQTSSTTTPVMPTMTPTATAMPGSPGGPVAATATPRPKLTATPTDTPTPVPTRHPQ